MDRLPLSTFPEIQERLIFPFARPLMGPSVSPFSVPKSSRSTESSRSSSSRIVTMTAGGVNIEERVSARHLPGPEIRTESIPNHKYSARHSFGHFLASNDLNQLLAHSRVPAFSRTSDDLGLHYRHHQQRFERGSNFRLPLPAGVSTTVADRFRAQTSLMFQ